MHIHTDPHVYGPEEDSYLLLEALEHEELSGSGLEIGIGTGMISLHVCHHFTTFTGVDINPQAVTLAQKNAQQHNISAIQFFESDLFSNVTGTFDVIIFNPPYVPADGDIKDIEDFAYHGGVNGRQTIDHFLLQVEKYLNPRGKVYLLQSSLSGIDETCSILKKNYSFDIVARKKLFFEELVVFRIVKEEV